MVDRFGWPDEDDPPKTEWGEVYGLMWMIILAPFYWAYHMLAWGFVVAIPMVVLGELFAWAFGWGYGWAVWPILVVPPIGGAFTAIHAFDNEALGRFWKTLVSVRRRLARTPAS